MEIVKEESLQHDTGSSQKQSTKTTDTSSSQGATGVNGACGLRAFAQQAGNLHFSVVPTIPGEKRPFGAWKVYQKKLPTPTEIAKWFTPDVQGVGVITGKVSGNLEAIDFDDHLAFDTYCELASRAGLGALWDRVLNGYLDGSPRGSHVLYRCETIESNQKLASTYDRDESGEIKRDAKGKALTKALIETRGEGGFLVIPPSAGNTHPSGRSYVQVHGGLHAVLTITPEERESLLELARTLDEIQRTPHIEKAKKGERKLPGTRPGDLFNANATWAEILTPHGWVAVHVDKGITYWRRPGKSSGISASTNYADSDLFYCFSTSSEFDSERGYSKFSAYVLLDHNGDYKKAAKVLRAQGYNAPTAEGGGDPRETDPQE